uniref:Gamma-tubulin complex component n=1 Tax=Parascaris univalens TaxID=6257 RepID=A0A915AXS0_PARUN
MSAWKSCRKEIVKKLLPFSKFTIPNEFYFSAPPDYFVPMEQHDLSTLSIHSQEQVFVKDLLLVFSGYQADNIRFERCADSVKWTVNASADESLRSRLYAESCLPLAGILILLRYNIYSLRYDLERGRIAMAVAGVAEDFLNTDIMDLLIELERESREKAKPLNLSDIGNFTRPFMNIARQILDTIAAVVKRDLVGGEILTDVGKRVQSSVSQSARTVLLRMERAGLAQYYDLVFCWIRYGSLHQDKAHEFMVWDLQATKMFSHSEVMRGKDDDDLSSLTDGSFDQRYCVISELCPSQLASASSDIVKCGKYLNIIEQIKGETSAQFSADENKWLNGNEVDEWRDMEVEDVISRIRKTRIEASQRLVLLLRKQFGLDKLFESIRGFFLLEQSDWITSFIELADEQLMRSLKDIVAKAIQAHFEEAVDCSTLQDDRFRTIFRPILEKHNVSSFVRMIASVNKKENSVNASEETRATQSESESLRGADALSLQMRLASPLSLVFPPNFTINLAIIFRILFSLHRAMHLLYQKQLCVDLPGEERMLLELMLHSVNAYLSHCTMHAIPTLWSAFMQKISKSVSLEEILSHQASFVAETNSICMLSNVDFMVALTAFTTVVVEYSMDIVSYDVAVRRSRDALNDVQEALGTSDDNIASAQLQSRIFSRFY